MPSASTTSRPLAKSSGFMKSPGSAQSTAFINARHSFIQYNNSHMIQNNDQRGTSRKGFEVLCDNIDESLLHDSIDHDTEDFDCPNSGTEREMIEQIMEWAENPVHVARAALVHSSTTVGGVPTLGHSISKRCKEDGTLLAGISLPSTTMWDKKRDASARRRAVATLAYQIALACPAARPFIEAAIEHDPAIFRKSLRSQVERLVQEPLRQVAETPTEQPPSVLVLDGFQPSKEWHRLLLKPLYPQGPGSYGPFVLRLVVVLQSSRPANTNYSATSRIHQ